MKAKRLKHAQSVLNFYRINFKLKFPYHVLLDGTFCRAALKERINISEQVPKYLGCEISFFTTSCAVAECQAFGTVLYGPLKVLEQFTCYQCKHAPPKMAAFCLMSVLRKHKRRFILATQDSSLRGKVHGKAGIPILYIAHKTFTLEPPSQRSSELAAAKAAAKTDVQAGEMQRLQALKKQMFDPQKPLPRKKKRPLGPNPLSCKKKKKRTGGASQSEADEGKRKRRKRKKRSVLAGTEASIGVCAAES